MRSSLLLLLCAPLIAQTYSAVSVDKITPSGARVLWTTSIATPSHINWGTVSGSLTSSNASVNGFNTTSHQWYISGAPPATVIYYKVCASAVSCDATERSFTTSAQPSTYPNTPVAPASFPLPAMPTIDGTTLTVDATCSNFSAHLNTLKALDGDKNHKLVIPAGVVCAQHSGATTGNANSSQVAFPTKTGANPSGTGVIIITTDATLPPEGARITSDWSTSYMVNTVVGILELSTAPSSGGLCVSGQMYWDYLVAVGGTWALKECTTPAAGAGGYTLVAKTTFTGTPPTPCTANTWYQKTDASDVALGLYRCDDLGRMLQVQIGLQSAFEFSIGTTAKGYRFVGITFDALRWPTASPPSWLTSNSFVYGSYFSSLFDFSTATNVSIDRCRFIGGSYPNRYQNFIKLAGTYNYIANSSIEGISLALTPAGGAEPSNQTEFTGINISGGQYILFDNNWMEGPGILLHGTDDTASQYAQDVRVTRNYFSIPDTYWYNSATSNGHFYHNRHGVELKRGVRWLIEGNTFAGGFSTVNQAHAVDVSFRPGSYGATVLLTDIDITNNTITDHSNAVYLSGHNDNDSEQGQAVQRVRVANNLMYGIDGDRFAAGYGQRFGNCVQTALGGEDVIVENNICLQTGNGQYPAVLLTDTAGGLYGSLKYVRNFATHVVPQNLTTGISRANNANRGTATLTAAFQQYTATQNGFINLSSQTTTDYPAGNSWPATLADVGFANTAVNDYRLKFSSTYAPTGAGADIDSIRATYGEVYNLRALSITSTAATVYYTAPDATNACTVEYGTSATPGTGSRVTDSTGSRFRTKALTGLASGTGYHFRVYCSQMAAGTFTTN